MQELENTQLEPLNSHNTKPLMKGVGNAGIQLDCERKRSFTKFSKNLSKILQFCRLFELCIFEFPPDGSNCVFSSYVFSSFHKLSKFLYSGNFCKNSYSRRFYGFPAGSLQLSSTVSYYANLVVRVVYFRVEY
jgi:hypothetical protein